MSEESGPAEPPERALARDWITIWQSELAGLAADREAQETWQKLLALWGEAAWAVLGAAAGAPPQAREHPDGSTGTAQPPRTAPAAAAPDARDGEIARLGARLDALEQRLAELERRPSRAARARGGKRRT